MCLRCKPTENYISILSPRPFALNRQTIAHKVDAKIRQSRAEQPRSKDERQRENVKALANMRAFSEQRHHRRLTIGVMP